MLYSLSTLLLAKPFVSSFHNDWRCSIHKLLLGKTSVSDCFNSFRFSGYPRLVVIRKIRSVSSSAKLKHHVAGSKQNSVWDMRSPPPMPFDICQKGNAFPTSINDSKMHQPGASEVLRPGMVLLKGYLTQDEQVSIVRECRRLGLGPGGFYWPHMRLMLMCLGLDWDPQTRKYSKTRRFDKARVPNIPHEFVVMVRRAMEAARALTDRKYRGSNVEDILPMMSPDVCIVNFYTTQGRLGLHQDRDESRGSLEKGLPIVSISVGDSAEFFFGDARDLSTAKKVILKSGDVVIFGGPSRHIFHGVQSIVSHSAPEYLLEKTSLSPGRLNLTFRQF